MDKKEICRLCASKKDDLLMIYGDDGLRLSIESKIIKYLNIHLKESSNLPTSVCLECCTKLDAFEEFFENCKTAQSTLCLLFSEEKPCLKNVSVSDEEYNIVNTDNDEGLDETFQEPQDTNKRNLYNVESKSIQRNGSADQLNVNEEQGNKKDITRKEQNVEIAKYNKDFEPISWLCSDCSEELSSVHDLRTHYNHVHKQETKYMCSCCSKVFHIYSAFLTHLKRHKSISKYSCLECGKGFSNKKVLETHTSVHAGVRPYVCGECGKSFRQQSALYIHSRCHLPEDIKNKFPCTLCNKRFSTKPNLVTHMRIHTGIRNFTCDQCGKSFIQKGNLDAHLLTHSHDKPYSCELCNKRFKTMLQLRKHHSVHTGAKPHECDVCGRTFREKGTLREHHRIHTGAMPFTCEFCGKAFRFKGILTTHRRQHTGERPYSCFECQHHFTNWPNYNKHMKRRHGINTSRTTQPGSDIQTSGQPPPYVSEINGVGSNSSTDELFHQQEGQTGISQYIYGLYSLSQIPVDPLSI